MEQNEVKCPFLGTMVLKAKKTSVLVLIPGLFDRSRSRTVDTLVVTLLTHLLQNNSNREALSSTI